MLNIIQEAFEEGRKYSKTGEIKLKHEAWEL